MNFVIKVICGDTTKEYTIPDNIDVQCGSGDEIGESVASYGVRCSIDITDGEMVPTLLYQIKTDCLLFENYSIQCLFDGAIVFEQTGMSAVKYRVVKLRSMASVREEVLFYA